MKTKRLENLPGLEEGSWAEIRKFSYAQASKIRAKATKLKYSAQNSAPEAEIEILDSQFSMLVYGIERASFFGNDWTEEQKRAFIEGEELPAETGDFLFNEINIFNGPSPSQVKK